MPQQRRRIAFLGTGLMGLPMAGHLLAAGHGLTVWNRTAAKAAPLADRGARLAADAADAVADAEVVVSMVSDGSVLLALVEDTGRHLTGGAAWIDMSSTTPGDARTAADRLARRGVAFLDAPVSGGTRGAEAATLAIMAGGPAATLADVRPVLDLMGRVTRVGDVGAGQVAKLANQAIVGATIAAVAEATLLLEHNGVDATAVREALRGGFADSTILQLHGRRMSERDFVPGGLARLQLKDLDNALAVVPGLDMPALTQARDRFARYVSDLDGAERDHAGLFEELLDRNGLR